MFTTSPCLSHWEHFKPHRFQTEPGLFLPKMWPSLRLHHLEHIPLNCNHFLLSLSSSADLIPKHGKSICSTLGQTNISLTCINIPDPQAASLWSVLQESRQWSFWRSYHLTPLLKDFQCLPTALGAKSKLLCNMASKPHRSQPCHSLWFQPESSSLSNMLVSFPPRASASAVLPSWDALALEVYMAGSFSSSDLIPNVTS